MGVACWHSISLDSAHSEYQHKIKNEHVKIGVDN